jgi:hypothetical protein
MFWILLITGLALAAGGAYVYKEGRERTDRVIMREDGGNPSRLFLLFYKSYYFKYKNDKKHRDGFPDNYYGYLVSSGVATAVLGALLMAIAFYSFLDK